MRRILALASALAVLSSAVLSAEGAENDSRRRIVELAISLKGSPYVYGADSPSGFDCSGFVHYVYSSAAYMDLPRSSREQYAQGTPVALAVAKPGDVLVYGSSSGVPDHVAIFLGGGSMIHAASDGPRTGIIVSSLGDFGSRFLGARSFLSAGSAKAGGAQAKAVPGLALARALADKLKSAPLVAEVGFTVSSKSAAISDPIPAALGSAIAFTITNGTGKDASFRIVFYKASADGRSTRILREERVQIKAEDSRELAPFSCAEGGVYHLGVRGADNIQLMHRTWRVVEVRR